MKVLALKAKQTVCVLSWFLTLYLIEFSFLPLFHPPPFPPSSLFIPYYLPTTFPWRTTSCFTKRGFLHRALPGLLARSMPMLPCITREQCDNVRGVDTYISLWLVSYPPLVPAPLPPSLPHSGGIRHRSGGNPRGGFDIFGGCAALAVLVLRIPGEWP